MDAPPVEDTVLMRDQVAKRRDRAETVRDLERDDVVPSQGGEDVRVGLGHLPARIGQSELRAGLRGPTPRGRPHRRPAATRSVSRASLGAN